MQTPTDRTPTEEIIEVPDKCPKCGSELQFEKDGVLEEYVCPNLKCGYKFNPKKEQWKKEFLNLKPTQLPEVHISCNFCKNLHSEKCTDSPNPNTCPMYEEDKNISHANKIIMLVDQQQPVFFKDQHRTSRVWLKDKGVFKSFKIDSTDFRDYITELFYIHFGKAPSATSPKEAMVALEGLTRNAKTINVRNRVTLIKGESGEDEIWIDLCNNLWQSVRITSNGYEIVNQTPPIFRRFDHMEALCLPKKDGKDAKDSRLGVSTPPTLLPHISKEEKGEGENSCNQSTSASLSSFKNLWRIFDYLRVPTDDQLLILSALVSYFFVDYPYVCVYIYGASGKGKSTGVKCIKKLIDPSTTIILEISPNRDQLLQDMDHHFFCAYDNVGYISNEYSDAFCRGSTGYGICKRVLYSNDKDFIRTLKRPFWFNGISIVITREDLLKRVILSESLSLVGKERTEDDIYAEFEEIKPYILHELYTLVSQVLAKLPSINTESLFRMADYTKIGCAVAEVLGYKQEFFIEKYRVKLNEQIQEVIWNNTLGNVLFDFIENLSTNEWRGTPSALYKELKIQAQELGVSTRTKDYPKAPNKMSQEMNRLEEAFSKIGISLEYIKGTKREWHIIDERPEEPKTEPEKMEELRNYIVTERKDSLIHVADVTAKIEELELEYEKTILTLRTDALLLEDSNPEFWRVTR